MLKRILSAVLTVAMLLTVFTMSAAAATSTYVKKPVSIVSEDFDSEDGTHIFTVYHPEMIELIEGEDGKAMSGNGHKGVAVDLPEKYITEFDFVHTIEEANSESFVELYFVDKTSSAAVNNFGMRIGVLPFTANNWYSMKIEVDTSYLANAAAGNTPAGAVNVFWKKKGAENWIAATQKANNTFDSSEILYYRSHTAFGSNTFGDNAIGFSPNLIIDNFELYYEADFLDSVCEGYLLNEDFEGSSHVFSAGTVANGAVSYAYTITAPVNVPDYAVIEFDAYRSDTKDYDVYIKYSNDDTVPHFGMRIMAQSYYADKWYSYKIIVKKEKLVNDNNSPNSSAIIAYRKAADESEWKFAPMSSGYNAVDGTKNDGSGPVGTVGEPMIRFHNGIGSANLPENAIGFSANTILDNIRVSGGEVITVSDFAVDDSKIGATVEFKETDATAPSGNRSFFCAFAKEDRIVKVAFENPAVSNGVWTAEMEAEKTDFDSIRLFVWDENNAPAVADWDVTSIFASVQ